MHRFCSYWAEKEQKVRKWKSMQIDHYSDKKMYQGPHRTVEFGVCVGNLDENEWVLHSAAAWFI